MEFKSVQLARRGTEAVSVTQDQTRFQPYTYVDDDRNPHTLLALVGHQFFQQPETGIAIKVTPVLHAVDIHPNLADCSRMLQVHNKLACV